MASKITSEPIPKRSIGMNPAPQESTLGSDMQVDMQESSIKKCPIKMIHDLAGGALKTFQQIFMAEANPQVIQEDGDAEGANTRVHTIPNKVVKEFKECLLHHQSNKLLEMVNQFLAQLFLSTISTNFSRSALHVAVLESSPTLVHALLEKMEEEGRFVSRDSKMDSKMDALYFMLKVDDYGLSAVDMAALIGNEEILSHFEGILEFKKTDLEVLFNSDTNLLQCSKEEKMNLLREASPLLDKQAPPSIHQGTEQFPIQEWLLKENVDFVYCLHEASRDRDYSPQMAQKFVTHVFDNGDSCFLKLLFNVRDKLGRSPLHVYGYSYKWFTDIISFLNSLVAHFPNLDLNMLDFCRRTPLHWAVAQGFVNIVTFLTSQNQTNLNATYGNLCGWKNKGNCANFNVDDVDDVTPLHLAVIHNHVEVVEALLKVPIGRGLKVNAICTRKVQFSNGIFDEGIWQWTPFQLAAYMGHERIVPMLLKDPHLYDPRLKKRKNSAPTKHNKIPALHLATSQFHSLVVETLVKALRMNALVEDKEGNTTLHYVTMHAYGPLQVHINLHDYVTVSHFTSKPPISRKPSDHDIITCMEILMQSEVDVEKKNKRGVAPTLQSSCSKKVQEWWSNIVKEAQDKKNDLIIAANSVSVTAALVATVSFVGPLQPSLGLLNEENPTWLDGYSHVKHTSVEEFLFCNSLSFYFAIAAVVFAMLPSWPIPREWREHEGNIARRCVQVAVLFLFGSIIFVLCTFSVANIAIVPNKTWRYKIIVVISTSLGILTCFSILFLSFMRLLTLISPRNQVARKISNVGI